MVNQGTATMAKKKAPAGGGESRRYGTLIRVDDDMVELAKKVAALRGVSMAEYISETMLPIVRRDLTKEVRKLSKGGGDE
jgi:hypothetical protein